MNGSHQVLSIWQNKNAQNHLITVHYVALLGIIKVVQDDKIEFKDAAFKVARTYLYARWLCF